MFTIHTQTLTHIYFFFTQTLQEMEENLIYSNNAKTGTSHTVNCLNVSINLMDLPDPPHLISSNQISHDLAS